MIPIVRTATAADGVALCRLAARVPMVGPIAYCLERDPDFFALTRLQSDRAEVLVVDGPEAGAIVAMGTHAPWTRRWNGAIRSVSYLGDLKVDPSYARRGLGGALMEGARDRMREMDSELGLAVVLDGNRRMRSLIDRVGGPLAFTRVATLRHATIVGARFGRDDVSVRHAEPADLGAMVALWNRAHRGRDLARSFDESSFAARVASIPGLSLDAFRLVHRGGRLVALGAAWDASAIKRVRVLSVSPALRGLRRVVGPLTRWGFAPALPRDGEVLACHLATHFAAEDAEALRALLAGLVRGPARGGTLEIALDTRDPWIGALRGFVRASLDFELHAVLPAGRSARPGRPVYFEMEFV